MESEWHQEVIRIGQAGSGMRVAARLAPGIVINPVTHFCSNGDGVWAAVEAAVVGDSVILNTLGTGFPFWLVNLLVVPDKPAMGL